VSRLARALVAALVLTGCAAPPRMPEGAAVPDPAMLQHWTASGRLAVKAGDEGGSGAFEWRQDGATSQLDLRGPLGAGAVSLTVAPGTLSLADGAGRVLDADAARADLQARLGADLPWDHLRYWLLGVAAPGEAASVIDGTAAPLRLIEQSGWRLAYDSFDTVQGSALPQRFSAERGGVRVRVIVDAWSVAPPAVQREAVP
jgi:outer membrane lipoprotein LolB